MALRHYSAVKWSLGGVTLLLLIVWIASAWFWVGYWVRGDWNLVVMSGCVFSSNMPKFPGPSNLWCAGVIHPQEAFNWRFGSYNGGWGIVTYWPLWAAVAPALLATAVAWRLEGRAWRRERVGKCRACGYDRARIALQAACPECGATGQISKL